MKRLNVSFVCIKILPYKVAHYIGVDAGIDKIELSVSYLHSSLICYEVCSQVKRDLQSMVVDG